ncbi:MAG: DUF4175 family protein [Planctomycetes bacterium]|nr:DUF4175 family protein [Planctomycetota bacterium]
MPSNSQAFQRRLAKVRRRWKAATALDGALVVATEALGLFLVLMLADAIYSFSGAVRLGLLGVAAALLAAVFVWRVLAPLFRRIPDEQIALYIEERSPQAEGAVISALECSGHASRVTRHGSLSSLIGALLVGDAVHRIDATNSRAFANLSRLRKHLLVALGLLALFALTSVVFPEYARAKGERILVPWETIRRERELARLEENEARLAQAHHNRPIEINVLPTGMRILRGKGVEFMATLSRDPLTPPVFHYQFAGTQGKEHAVEMEKAQARFGFRLPFRDINESFTYRVSACGQTSAKYEIEVYDPLAVRGIELTYHFPSYLGRDPQTTFGPSGDVTALAGTRVDVRIIANNQLTSGALKLDSGSTIPLKPGARAEEGATASFTVEKDSSYSYEIADRDGQSYKYPDFFFIKAVPDKPPTITMVAPKVDMSVHPLCEITFAGKVSDDFAIKEAIARLSYYRDGKAEPLPLAMVPTTQKDFRNFLDGRVEYTFELEKVSPAPKIGDMIFYFMEVTDQKGQTAKTDLFFIKLMPLEVAASWPASPTPPDLPHWDYLWTPDIILLAAAAWHIEQQRGKIPTAEFQNQCTELAGRMEPALNSQNGLNLLGGKAELPRHIREKAAPILAAAGEKLRKALDLVREYEPGKAALEMQQAMAMAESINVAKSIQELQLATAPLHTGQPSGGYSQDAVMQQAEFRLPEVMSDSLTAFQQEDNPRHFKPPDYRRALRLKERTGPLTKELAMAGEIYASQEQLIEMAREMFGHRKLREAAEMSCTTDPAAGGGTKGDMIRIDKRAIPYASMDPRADMPDIGHGGEMKKAETEKLKGGRYARLRDNERAGPGNPHRSQTPGGGSSDPDEDEPKEKSKKKRGYTDEQWKVEVNDRRPSPSQPGGGGGESDQQQQPQPGMQQPSQPGGGSNSPSQQNTAQQMAARQQALADRAAQLARDVARNADPANPMGERAAGGLRDASREMRQAADSFQRGDLAAAMAQARRAQQAMRAAMHGLKAAQFESLGEALAAAQQGASALAQNQSRISQGTQQVEDRIRELSGEAGDGQTAEGAPGKGQPGKGIPGKGTPGKGEPGKGEPGEGQAGEGQAGEGTPGKGQPGKGVPGKGTLAKGTPGKGAPGKGTPGKGTPGKGEPGKGEPGEGEPGSGDQSSPGTRHAARGTRSGPSRGAVDKAKAQDPRIAGRMQGLAGEQLKLSEAVKEFDAYVNDLAKWAKEGQDERLASSLRDVADGLKRDDVAQKMVDAGVDLSQDNIGSARATQEEIEGALDGITGRLRDAGDVLAGSKTGIISRTARQAREIGERVRQIAGLPSGQPGQGQPGGGESASGQPSGGQSGGGEPGKGQPSQGAPGKGEPGKGEPGKGAPGKGEPGKGEPGKGQPGKGEPGKGEPGKGESSQGEAGKGEPGKGEPGKGAPGKGTPGKGEDSLAQRLADAEKGDARGASTPGTPGGGSNVGGGAGTGRDDVDQLWLKARDFADTLRDEELADPTTLNYLDRRVQDPESFRQMFDKVRQAEAGKFASVVTGIGKSLDEVLKETLSAKRLQSERGEECPPQYRSFVDAYFESLSKTATGKASN